MSASTAGGGERPESHAMHGPLRGVVVLSLAEQFPGPYATLLMADMGADVIMIERPEGGDPARAFPDFFAAIARNKRSVCLNLKVPRDLVRFKDMVRRADVVLEGYAPGVAARLGIDYHALQPLNPSLIFASISGFGQTGPYRDRRRHDLSYQAISGLLFDRAQADGPMSVMPYGDIAAAMFAAYATTTALFAREKTGMGTYIDVAAADSLVSWMTPVLGPALNKGLAIDVGDSPAYGLFACRDGHTLSLSIAHEDHFWHRLCAVLGLTESTDLNHKQRISRNVQLREEICDRMRQQDLAYWSGAFDEQNIPWAPLSDVDAVLADAHFEQRGLYVEVKRTDGSIERHIRQPVLFSNYSSDVTRPSPQLGENTHDEI